MYLALSCPDLWLVATTFWVKSSYLANKVSPPSIMKIVDRMMRMVVIGICQSWKWWTCCSGLKGATSATRRQVDNGSGVSNFVFLPSCSIVDRLGPQGSPLWHLTLLWSNTDSILRLLRRASRESRLMNNHAGLVSRPYRVIANTLGWRFSAMYIASDLMWLDSMHHFTANARGNPVPPPLCHQTIRRLKLPVAALSQKTRSMKVVWIQKEIKWSCRIERPRSLS